MFIIQITAVPQTRRDWSLPWQNRSRVLPWANVPWENGAALPAEQRPGRWMEGLRCYRRDDRHAAINHVAAAKHTKFLLSHSAGVSFSSCPAPSCSQPCSAGPAMHVALPPLAPRCSTAHPAAWAGRSQCSSCLSHWIRLYRSVPLQGQPFS